MLKVKNKKTPEQRQPFSSVSTVDFEQVNVTWGIIRHLQILQQKPPRVF